jgi:uncharacterized protein (TIGR02391 family)
MNIRLIAVEVGDLLKWNTSVNEIDRIGGAVFPFRRDTFPNESITSVRAARIYDWCMSVGRHSCTADDRSRLLTSFLLRLTNIEAEKARILEILRDAGVEDVSPDREILRRFDSRGFHGEIIAHSRKLFGQGHFFHAVFEAAKVYNKAVRDKARSTKDGTDLMLSVWGPETGVLKVTACHSDTDKNVQEGIKFLSSGLMRAIRNPTSHEPALHWPIDEQDAADILAFMSFLFRQLDKAVYFKP